MADAMKSIDINDEEILATVNRTSTISAAMWMTVVGTLGILFLPLMVSGIIDDLDFSKKQAGYIAAIEMAGIAIATGFGIFWVRRVNWVLVASIATIVLAVANWASTGIGNFEAMFVTRFVVGLASGALLAIGMACQSDSDKADHIFGYWVAAQMTVSSVGYILLPRVRESFGVDGFFLAIALTGLTAFIAILFLPQRGIKRESVANSKHEAIVTSSFALFGALLFFMAQGGVWAFLERLGLAANLSVTQIGFALAISSYLGIVGGLAKNWATDFMGPLSPFAIVVIGELGMLVIFATNPGNLMFIVAVCALQFCWAMGMAAFLSSFNLIDQSGGLVLLLMSVAKVGYSLGPALMGWLIVGDDYSYVIMSAAAMVVAGMLIAAFLIKARTAAIDT